MNESPDQLHNAITEHSVSIENQAVYEEELQTVG